MILKIIAANLYLQKECAPFRSRDPVARCVKEAIPLPAMGKYGAGSNPGCNILVFISFFHFRPFLCFTAVVDVELSF